MRRSKLTISQVLAWADQYHERHGRWPGQFSGQIPDTNEDWFYLDRALRKGWRGFSKGSSLPRLLAQHRDYRNKKGLPTLTEGQIVKWADAWRRRTGAYPRRTSGPIRGIPGETWARVNSALSQGLRGLRGGSSLARLLSEYRDERNDKALARLTITQILTWADAHHRRTGAWPKDRSGEVAGVRDQTWLGVDMALRNGLRGLSGGSSLPRLLSQHRGVKNEKALPRLTLRGIWAWMVSHYCRTETWPRATSGRVMGTHWETSRHATKPLLRKIPRYSGFSGRTVQHGQVQ